MVLRLVLALLVGLLTMIFAPGGAAAGEAPGQRYVLVPGLVLHQGPGRATPALDKLAYGAAVLPLAPGPAGTEAGAPGRWIKVRAGSKQGYLFDQFISPVPAPSLTGRDFTSALTKLGQLKEEKGKDLITFSQRYSHGVTVIDRKVKMGDGGYFTEQVIKVSGISVVQGFLLARAILAVGGLKDPNMARWPQVDKRGGLPHINDDSAWQIIAVQAEEGSVSILFPERAD